MKLMIIESPNKVKKLKSFLSSEFEIIPTVGHIFDLPKKDLGVDVSTFETVIVADSSKREILSNIKSAADRAEIIYLASDKDAEGERISKDIFDFLSKKNQKKCHRLLITAITKEAVEKAIKSPTTIDLNSCDAQKSRRVIDRLVGYQVSPVMWSKGLKGTSAGRVQSVALKYIAELEKEITQFKPTEYWTGMLDCSGFSAELNQIDGITFDVKSRQAADDIMKDVKSAIKTAIVTDYVKKSRTRSPEPPFTTSTLQQAGSSAFGWNAKKIMDVAQALFVSGHVSYIRTDSVRVEPEKIDAIRDHLELKHGTKYVASSAIVYLNKDASHDAHEAIRPTYDSSQGQLSSDEKKLLDLIDSRFKASQMADAKFDQASVKIEIKSKEHTYQFKANGSVMTFDGFLKVYGDNKQDVMLPIMSVGSNVSAVDFSMGQHFTQPPGRYSDASIIKQMEKDGVGRPSTYASTIETLLYRGYIERDKKALRASELGLMVSDYLTFAFPKLVSSDLTAKMESNLDLIAAGKVKYVDTMTAFYAELKASIDAAKKIGSSEMFKVDRKCEKCGEQMMKKVSSYGPFLSCSTYPKCGHTIKILANGKEESGSEETGEACPECKDGILKERVSKYGPWIGCSGYPICKYVKKDKAQATDKPVAEKSELTCPLCKSHLLKRIGKDTKPWFSCSTYPKCKYTYSEKSKTKGT